MPDVKIFVDSATFLYTLDEFEPLRRDTARTWLRTLLSIGSGIRNLRVLNETASVLTRKAARFPNINVFAQIDAFATFGRLPLGWRETLQARELRRRTRYSW